MTSGIIKITNTKNGHFYIGYSYRYQDPAFREKSAAAVKKYHDRVRAEKEESEAE